MSTAINGFDDRSLFAPPPERKAQDELGQEDFLTLMITQFQNQDPFEPMDTLIQRLEGIEPAFEPAGANASP